ncbi:LysR family transcriptional regulator [Billgrantia gudaonensis]|uniref:DNA-binding transcriptional regulator, LysR family n=1 Tax=Billgrantia gudaonensis TaxID=376427 RepID=A0A1G8R6F7_9GAMM|nr:LysR family transcriptional regulator [Halomonas gudaonensis]SDJ11970.1 DNA-binding transcriptional regulator, LysR family [Halomonas gudaonensis]
MNFDWDNLRLFLAIARAGTLAGAARALGVNHSTIFRRLKALEAGLEVRLFDRLAQGYVPTAAGEMLLKHAERVEEEAQAIERELGGQDVRLSGRVVVTTTDTLANAFLAPVFQGFIERYPGIELELLSVSAFLELARREADIAIRPTQAPPENLIGRRVGTIRWGVYGAREYLQDRPALEDPARPEGHRFVGGNEMIRHLASSRWLDERVPPEAFALRTNSVVAALGAARAGVGLAVVPHYMARQENELECVLAIGPEVATDLWLLVHPDLRHSARIRAFMSFAAEEVRQRQAELEGR